MRVAKIFVGSIFAGMLIETLEGKYQFQYDATYYQNPKNNPISLTLPKRASPYISKDLFPFFDGLIPEGWLLEIGIQNWKINPRDRMGLLVHLCKDCIGNVSVVEGNESLT